MNRRFTLGLVLIFLFSVSFTQNGYQFEDVKVLPVTSIKNQFRSGTCWSFSGISFLESELLRMGKGEYDLSEMYIVRKTYEEKAQKYVRMHGTVNFAGGGAFNDVTMVMEKYGIVTEAAYPGLNYGEEKHVHAELDGVLKAYLDKVITNPNKKLSSAWYKGFTGILDAYFGEEPAGFSEGSQGFTPQSFAENTGLDMNDYVMISSFTHHPFYHPFILEVPDNWNWGKVYNVKIKELTEIIDHAIENGYTVAWATDVSEKGFNWKKGFAVVPVDDIEELEGLERNRWDEMSDKEKEDYIYDFSSIKKEKIINQELRQEGFENYLTTDDHGMHIVGLARDQEGNPYYKVKNSWSNINHIYNGYLYASKSFVEYKTTSLLLHKDALPAGIRKKLGI